MRMPPNAVSGSDVGRADFFPVLLLFFGLHNASYYGINY